MTASIENIVQHLFHQPTLQSVSVDELQQMTQEYPSFAAARFLLLKKMQDSGHPDFTSQLHKTALYFNNPLWLQLLLLPQNEASIGRQHTNGYAVPPELPHIEPVQAEEPEPVLEQDPVIQEVLDGFHDHTETADTTPQDQQPEIQQQPEEQEQPQYQPAQQDTDPLIQEVLDRLRGHIHEAETGEATQEPEIQEPVLPEPVTQEPAAPAPLPLDQDPLIQEVLDRLRGHIDEADTMPQEQPGPAAEVIQETPYEQQEPVTEAVQESFYVHSVQQETEIPAPTANFHIPAEIATQDDQPKEEDFAPFPDTEHTPAAPVEPVAPPAELQPIFKTIIETPSAQNDLLFEPYHTIDYFASLGIRLDKVEPNPQDKLGKQLKSFTEWLKSMRKLPQASIEKALGENEESAVVAAASHSVEGKDVITEAMAEVFEKQGLNDKAAEVYRKLSLLNPSKSAYFAGRINALKQ